MGKLQAEAVGKRLKDDNIRYIYSSPLKRAYDTAAEIARFHGLPVVKNDGFIDMDFGEWQGKLHEDIKKQFPKLYSDWQISPDSLTFPDGDNLERMRVRIRSAIDELIEKHQNDKIVVVTHGAVLRVIMCIVNNEGVDKYWQFDMDNCAITTIECSNGLYSILRENENNHVQDLYE
jgi:broad specificity phosphatase PhoE